MIPQLEPEVITALDARSAARLASNLAAIVSRLPDVRVDVRRPKNKVTPLYVVRTPGFEATITDHAYKVSRIEDAPMRYFVDVNAWSDGKPPSAKDFRDGTVTTTRVRLLQASNNDIDEHAECLSSILEYRAPDIETVTKWLQTDRFRDSGVVQMHASKHHSPGSVVFEAPQIFNGGPRYFSFERNDYLGVTVGVLDNRHSTSFAVASIDKLFRKLCPMVRNA